MFLRTLQLKNLKPIKEHKLLSLSLIDILDDGISMVYSIFEPGTEKRSLGKYMILDQIELARELKLDYVYLGYWVEGSPKMDYKKEYKPLEVFKNSTWKSTKNLYLKPSADQKSFESQIIPDPIYYVSNYGNCCSNRY